MSVLLEEIDSRTKSETTSIFPNKISVKNLKTALANFKGKNWKNSAKCSNWTVSKGGYDLWFEIYYNNIPVMQCIADKLNWCYSERPSCTEELLAVTKKIMNL